jgi:hypothetical protein
LIRWPVLGFSYAPLAASNDSVAQSSTVPPDASCWLCGVANSVIDVAQVEQIESAVRASPPGRYHVAEISADPLPSGHTFCRWGIAIKNRDGSVVIERDP